LCHSQDKNDYDCFMKARGTKQEKYFQIKDNKTLMRCRDRDGHAERSGVCRKRSKIKLDQMPHIQGKDS
jgi:hypothetical protein